jgi:RNA polymerase sigma-70 factor (ECF subfamily)
MDALVRRAQGGDRSAFDELLRRERAPVEAWVMAHLGPKLAVRIGVDDVLQETFLWAFRGIANLRWSGEESFRHWLVSIAKHVIQKEARKGKQVLGELDGDVVGPQASPSKILRRDERFDRLEDALQGLSAEHRRVIELARVEGLPVEEIARRTGRSPNATSQLLRRALKKLRERFGDTESLGLPDRPLSVGGDTDGA